MNKLQIMALSDAYAFSGRNQMGLQRSGARAWKADCDFSNCHDVNTIKYLVRRGYLALYFCESVAHITDKGIEALEEHKELAASGNNRTGRAS